MIQEHRTQIADAVTVLHDAFAADPVLEWLWPGAIAEHAGPLFTGWATAAAAAGELAVRPGAAAVWLPVPSERTGGPPEDEQLPPRVRLLVQLLERHHPTGRPHLYLAAIGVTAACRGTGSGSALLSERLRRADADGVPAYLEASTARSVPLYERHGFRHHDTPIVLPAGPTLWPMWREPRGDHA